MNNLIMQSKLFYQALEEYINHKFVTFLNRALYVLYCRNTILTIESRFVRDEPYQEHRLKTVSNEITRGLKPVLRVPTLALCPGTVHMFFSLLSGHVRK